MAEIESEYQEQARGFQVGDLAYPLLGGSPGTAGEIVAIHPGIGMVDILFGGNETRYPIEDVHRIQRQALYWADLDRHYRGTREECDSGEYRCPRCREETSILRLVSYKRTQGQNHRILSCPTCHFLIKPSNVIGHPEYIAAQESTLKKASDQVTIGVLTLSLQQPITVETRDALQDFDRTLQRLRLQGTFRELKQKGRDHIEISFDLQDPDLLDTLGPVVLRHLDMHLGKLAHFVLFGHRSPRDVDYWVDDLGQEVRYSSQEKFPVLDVVVTVFPEGLAGPFSDADNEILEEGGRGTAHGYLDRVADRLAEGPLDVLAHYRPSAVYKRTGRFTGLLEIHLEVPDSTQVLDGLEDEVLEALAQADSLIQLLIFGPHEQNPKTRLEVL